MRTFASLGPLAAVLLVVVALLAWLLREEHPLAPWLVAAVLAAHGWVHLVSLLPTGGSDETNDDNPFDLAGSWLAQRLDLGATRVIGAVLAGLTFIFLLGAALAVLGWLVPSAWWAALAVAGSLTSTALLLVLLHPLLVLGFVIDLGVVALALQDAWQVPR